MQFMQKIIVKNDPELEDEATQKPIRATVNMPTQTGVTADNYQYYLSPEELKYLPFTPVEYGKRLRARREELHISRQVLADAVKCRPEYIRQIENGKAATINRDYVPVFAGILNCTAYYLVGMTDFVDGTFTEGQDGQRLPIMISTEKEVVSIRSLQRGYARDPELCLQFIKMLQAPPKEREYYKKELTRIQEGFHRDNELSLLFEMMLKAPKKQRKEFVLKIKRMLDEE